MDRLFLHLPGCLRMTVPPLLIWAKADVNDPVSAFHDAHDLGLFNPGVQTCLFFQLATRSLLGRLSGLDVAAWKIQTTTLPVFFSHAR